MTRLRVAVIGSGVSGLTAAYLLEDLHDVTLFERSDRLGGHANTVDAPTADGGFVPVDTGFIVHNDRTYPHLLDLFERLGVQTQPAEMSLSVSCGGCGLEYAGAKGLIGLFPSLRTLTDRDHLRMLGEVRRFHRHGARIAADPSCDSMTVGDLLAEGGYTEHFRDHYLLALIGCVWSSSQDLARQYPARHLVRFLDHHGMLSVTGSPQWRTVTGGSREYVRAIGEVLGDRVRLGEHVTGVGRDPDGVTVTVAGGGKHRFDRVVVATHPDQALGLLDDPTDDERAVLGAWRYSTNETVLHTDTSLLPVSPRARASWNYTTDRCGRDGDMVGVTYDLSRLMRLDVTGDRRYLVTLNRTDRIDPTTVIATMRYRHPVYTLDALAAQRDLSSLDAVPRTDYCGAWQGWGFHEDGCASGVRVARRLGASA